VVFSNSIVDGGSAPTGSAIAHYADAFSFSGVNLLGDSRVTSAEAFNFEPPTETILATSDGTQPTNLSEILFPLADNGGATLTHALPQDSPAIGAADNVICATEPVNNLDQRGEDRPIGDNCDIGAYEAVDVEDASLFVIPLPDDKAVIFEL